VTSTTIPTISTLASIDLVFAARRALERIAKEGNAAPPLTQEQAQALVESDRRASAERDRLLDALPEDD